MGEAVTGVSGVKTTTNTPTPTPSDDSDSLPTYGVVLIAILGVLVLLLIVGVGGMVCLEKQGSPLFTPLATVDDGNGKTHAHVDTHVGAANGNGKEQEMREVQAPTPPSETP